MTDIFVAATPELISELFIIEQQCHSHPWSEKLLGECISPRHLFYVLKTETTQSPLGFYIVETILDEATLLDICITPAQQGRGLANKLMTHLIDQLTAQQISQCFLEVRTSNANAITLYQRHGFIEVGRRKNYYPCASGREDALLMTLSL